MVTVVIKTQHLLVVFIHFVSALLLEISVFVMDVSRGMSKVLDLLMTCASNMKSGVLSLFPHVQECKVVSAMYITMQMWPVYVLCGLCLIHHP